MSTKVAYKVVYNRRKQLDRNGNAPVVIEAYQSGLRRFEGTGIRIPPDQWNAKKKESKNPVDNRLIRAKITEMENFELSYPLKSNRPFVLTDFTWMEVDNLPDNYSAVTFLDFAREQIEKDKASLSPGIYRKYLRAINYLETYNREQPVEFSALTFAFAEGFDYWQQAVKKLHANTIYKNHQIIKKYISNAIKKGLLTLKENSFHDYKAKQKAVHKDVLLPAEIKKIERLVFSEENKHLTFYRDIFLIGYYTALRIGDVTRLRWSDFVETDKGLMLQIRMQKTGEPIDLPLYALFPNANGLSSPEKLLWEYKKLAGDKTDKRLFIRSHQRINDYLKIVVKLAGIKKLVTFHTARRSGATYLATKVPIPVVQKLSGHKKITTTMAYVKTSAQIIENALDKVDWK